MTTQNDNKLKNLLAHHQPGTVSLAKSLEAMGISRELQTYYRRSGWLESVGSGAFKRPGDHVAWQGGLFALQSQAKLSTHVGAITALELQGFAHFARNEKGKVYLFSNSKRDLPTWFRNYDWGVAIEHVRTLMLPPALGMTILEQKTFAIRVSAPERAILECLHLTPEKFNIEECFQLMEGLVGLRPALVQELLEKCRSIKVKRLFLYMAERAAHPWLKLVKTSRINLGVGARSLTKGGEYNAKYRLVLPKALVKP